MGRKGKILKKLRERKSRGERNRERNFKARCKKCFDKKCSKKNDCSKFIKFLLFYLMILLKFYKKLKI